MDFFEAIILKSSERSNISQSLINNDFFSYLNPLKEPNVKIYQQIGLFVNCFILSAWWNRETKGTI